MKPREKRIKQLEKPKVCVPGDLSIIIASMAKAR